ncbi:MAG TPA: hypothetical protein VHB70_02525 [Parafilimonas sp.]|nr:hypothetical protein [Parafilimonas sp.]
MAALISNLPFRQKFLLIAALSFGIFIFFCSAINALSNDTINTLIFYYCFGLPFSLLGFSTEIDLNDTKIFLIWLAISMVLLIISLATNNSDKFLTHRAADFDYSSSFNAAMSRHSTSGLKSLFCFLMVYWILNQLTKKINGDSLVNTFMQRTWTNNDTKRKMTGVDVFCNIILYITIFASVLF